MLTLIVVYHINCLTFSEFAEIEGYRGMCAVRREIENFIAIWNMIVFFDELL